MPAASDVQHRPGTPRGVKLWRRIGLAVAMVAVVAGVVVAVSVGKDEAAETAPQTAVSTTSAAPVISPLDSFAWDPCGYFSPEMYSDVADTDPATGKPRVQINPNGFDDCEVHIALPGERYSELLVSSHNNQTPPPSDTYANAERFSIVAEGDWSVVTQREPLQGSCLRAVYSARSLIWIQTSLSRDQQGLDIDVCELVERASNTLRSALRTATVPQLALPSGSLGRVDMCSVLTDTEVTNTVALPGWTPPANRYRGHSCFWKATVSTAPADRPAALQIFSYDYAMVSVIPRLGKTPPTATTNDVTVDINGRPTILRLEGGACTATVAGKTWQPWPGKQVYQARYPQPDSLVESVTLAVILPDGSTDDTCNAVRALAARAWPRLS